MNCFKSINEKSMITNLDSKNVHCSAQSSTTHSNIKDWRILSGDLGKNDFLRGTSSQKGAKEAKELAFCLLNEKIVQNISEKANSCQVLRISPHQRFHISNTYLLLIKRATIRPFIMCIKK